MPPVTHSANEEAAFMADLLVDLDDTFWNAVPTPDPSPKKPAPSWLTTPKRHPRNQPSDSLSCTTSAPSPSKIFSAGDVDMTALLEGAEDWDWDDSNSDVLTPKNSPRKKAQVGPYLYHLSP